MKSIRSALIWKYGPADDSQGLTAHRQMIVTQSHGVQNRAYKATAGRMQFACFGEPCRVCLEFYKIEAWKIARSINIKFIDTVTLRLEMPLYISTSQTG